MKILSILFSFIMFLGLAKASNGHGGFEKSSGDTTVFITQDPTSPLVGEKVKLSFSLKDLSIDTTNLSDQNLNNISVKLNLIDTFFGDESKDKVILSKDTKTDENGDFDFEYTFTKENYYDVELTYKDKNGKEQEIGFLVQPREIHEKTNENNALPMVFSILIASLVGVFIGKRIAK